MKTLKFKSMLLVLIIPFLLTSCVWKSSEEVISVESGELLIRGYTVFSEKHSVIGSMQYRGTPTSDLHIDIPKTFNGKPVKKLGGYVIHGPGVNFSLSVTFIDLQADFI